MKHIFSSGEILYKQHIKELEEGILTAEYLEYETVEEDMFIKCGGELEGELVTVLFKVDSSEIPSIQFKQSVNILMQSDVFESQWVEYKIINVN